MGRTGRREMASAPIWQGMIVVAEIEITDAGSLENAINTAGERPGGGARWWRGHEDSTWKLQPRIFRPDVGNGSKNHELSMAFEFRRRAGPMHTNCPDFGDTAGWLFLMQHYGLPTRILDWTSSILVATFFAVRHEENDDTEGAVWALDPVGLNRKQATLGGLVTIDGTIPKAILDGVFSQNIGSANEVAIGVSGVNNDIRMLVQHAEFTLHGIATPLDDLPDHENFVIKFVIPAAAKPRLRKLLHLFGISEAGVFPDLAHLAAEISRTNYG